MHIIHIASKQITFVQYDDVTANMTVYYHTGKTEAFTNVQADDYQSLAKSTNSYDSLMKLTCLRLSTSRPASTIGT
ncbi:KTSC domain-containing protein [Paenibacillus eucommiae]|uniref:KTSC domain-containing protein n=1 Tax=Paenibacillus eucommiae TaxID=1355755 RepID=A0ABS4J169_9BACL|nr:KTSC domain-containing protein [Paenibacillus eucommiae]MBP1993577.1 hypothetical protein [Paenibacillus eucommiae]